jgi:ribonuclease R
VGRITEVLGDHMAPGMEVQIAIYSYDIPTEWPAAVDDEIAQFAVDVPESAKRGRVDLRKLPLVTIDGIDARDFDDAVYCEPRGNNWRLYVAIADVSWYVQPDSALDREAQHRGTSVYFPDRVIPMLPEALSNGLCSLNPEVDRLCLVCDMTINPQGQIIRSRFCEAVMHSHARLTYDAVGAMLEKRDRRIRREYQHLVPHLDNLYKLYKVLKTAREQRGAIDFDTQETVIEYDTAGKIERIVPSERNDAHRLIEECMISANIAAARFLRRQRIPALYRVHYGPSDEKLERLRGFLSQLGLTLGGGDQPSAKDCANLLEKAKTRADFHLIQTVLLRSLSQAVYSPDQSGHFGLALAAYAHFTSPIRRYPDLLVHRAIRHVLQGGNAENFSYSQNDMIGLGEHTSMTERRADEATRDAAEWLKCEYMLNKVGETFDGIVSGVTAFGLFIELEKVFVEGLLHVTSLPNDYYHFDPVGHSMQGKRTGKTYRLGDPVRIVVARVDLDERKIDFELAQKKSTSGRKQRRKK